MSHTVNDVVGQSLRVGLAKEYSAHRAAKKIITKVDGEAETRRLVATLKSVVRLV